MAEKMSKHNPVYLDQLTQGHMPVEDHKKFSNFKSSRSKLYLPDLSHCGIASTLSPQKTPATTRKGEVLAHFKREALEYGKYVKSLETKMAYQRSFQSLNHTTYLNKIMVRWSI